MDRSAYDRFDSREPTPKPDYNQGAFDDGSWARINEHGLDACPDGGAWFVESWRAGWMDADSSINAGDFEAFKVELNAEIEKE